VYRKCFLNTLHVQTSPVNTSSGFIGGLLPNFFRGNISRQKRETGFSGGKKVHDMRQM
jgi:hypothetical protein